MKRKGPSLFVERVIMNYHVCNTTDWSRVQCRSLICSVRADFVVISPYRGSLNMFAALHHFRA